MGKLRNPFPRSGFAKWYLEMAMGGTRDRGIMAQSRPIFRRPKRPSFRALIAAKNSLFLTPFSSFFQVAKKCAKLRNPYPRLECCSGGRPNRGVKYHNSCGNPGPHGDPESSRFPGALCRDSVGKPWRPERPRNIWAAPEIPGQGPETGACHVPGTRYRRRKPRRLARARRPSPGTGAVASIWRRMPGGARWTFSASASISGILKCGTSW